LNFNPAPLVINEITLVGSRCGLFPAAIRALERELIDPLPLISAVFPFDRAEEAFLRSQEAGVFKVLLRM
jgi:threonine dehydrogenase-like Zn-dependent dehydrogenase